MSVINTDCVAGLAAFPDNTFDSVVTDPPYELGFMGKTWDASGIAYSLPMWREVLRVLKPGGHMLAFSGSRTYHRMACAIDDAGFEIRDQIMWVYGSGFPKSLDVSKAIDKAAGAMRTKVPATGGLHKNANLNDDGWSKIGDADATMDSAVPVTAAAAAWQGWGTALKPAHEPICVARKPLIGTVAANVLAHGTGAINIDGCRVGTDVIKTNGGEFVPAVYGTYATCAESLHVGRWPANLIHDGSDEVLALFPREAGAAAPVTVRNADKFRATFGAFAGNIDEAGSTFHGDKGSAARFFYCAKASRSDRGEGNIHPTVKPTDLMRYLCRLVTPPGGLVLDPFTGSGSTGKAAVLEGFQFIGFELSAEYAAIAQARIDAARGRK